MHILKHDKRRLFMKHKINKNILITISLVILIIALMILWALKILDIATIGVIIACLGVIYYFIYVGANYSHSIYGGRFEEHFEKGDDKKNEQ